MKLMKIIDDADSTTCPVDALYFDGYSIAERLLEGLPIKITLTPEGNLDAHADWPKGIDGNHWRDIAIEFALYHDCFSTTPEMKDDDGFIDLT